MQHAISSAIKKLYDIELDVALTRPDEKFGDYASSAPLQLAKQLGKNPREVAEAIAEELQ